MGSDSVMVVVEAPSPATSGGHAAPVGSADGLGPGTSTTATAVTATTAEVTFDEPDVSAAPVADSAPAQAPPATAAPASGDEDDTAGSAEQVPPEAPNTHLPSAPFRGIVHIHWNPDTREDFFSPRVKLFDTARSELTETQLDPGELGPAPVGVDRCLMWPVVSPAGVELWFYGIQLIDNEFRGHGRVVAAAPWGGPMVVHTSDRVDWDFTYESFGTVVAYGDKRIVLTADSGGFTLTFGSQQAQFDLNPGRPDGAPPTTLDPDYVPEVDIGWLSWLAGTNGEFVAVGAQRGHSCSALNYLYIISLRTRHRDLVHIEPRPVRAGRHRGRQQHRGLARRRTTAAVRQPLGHAVRTLRRQPRRPPRPGLVECFGFFS